MFGLAVDADGCEVLTIEGLGSNGKLDPIQEAFMEFGALQCGYCTSGFILTAKALLDECPKPSDEQIRNYLAGNFCRCGCYQEIIQAVKNVASLSRDKARCGVAASGSHPQLLLVYAPVRILRSALQSPRS